MVGPGTGLAPFRGFIQERAKQVQVESNKNGEMVLFFGCRNANVDFLYREELLEYERQGVLKLITAFSRQTVRFQNVMQYWSIWENRENCDDLIWSIKTSKIWGSIDVNEDDLLMIEIAFFTWGIGNHFNFTDHV